MTNKYKIFFNNRILWVGGYNPVTDKQCYQAVQKYTNRQELQQFIEQFRMNETCNNALLYDDNADNLMDEVIACFKYIEAAGGVVKSPDNEILVIHRLGVWDLPKGKMEEGENPKETAVREVVEECGITAPEIDNKLTDTYHTYELKGKHVLKKTYWYAMTALCKELPTPQHEEDITQACWTNNLSEVYDNTYPSIQDVLKQGRYI
jgi:8-oxo-dGTP pyrophosphatase MutT (NUDIX family)